MEQLNKSPDALLNLVDKYAERLSVYPGLREIFSSCLLNAYETTMVPMDDGTYFFYTGDIHAMWNRDASQQITPYLSLVNESNEIKRVVKGAIERQLLLIQKDSYANSFNITPIGHHYADTDTPPAGPWTWEQKYETDTLCFPIRLAYMYWKKTGDASVVQTQDFARVVHIIVDQFVTEQHHDTRSVYRHQRVGCPWQDTLQNDGRGYPTKYTGMTWQGFRPSDDAAKFGYSIPSNMFVSVVLGYLQEIDDELRIIAPDLRAKLDRLKLEIEHGIEDFGIVWHPNYGRIYAYETDGFGNAVLADDANVPNLLSAPYLGFCSSDDPIYMNTRRFALSKDNPFYASGKIACGLGSLHTPKGYVWHMGLCMQGMTTESKDEVFKILRMLLASDAGTGYMHEGFDANNASLFTRPWFAASNSMFAEFILTLLDKNFL